jgi:hypothetical protein
MGSLVSPAPRPGRQVDVQPAERCLPVVGSDREVPDPPPSVGPSAGQCLAATSVMESESAFLRRKPLGTVTLQVGHRACA